MSHDLADLLEAAAPEPRRLLDPEVLLRTARRRVTVRRRFGGGLGAAVVAGAVAGTLVLPPGGHPSAATGGGITTPTVSALVTTTLLPPAATRALAGSPFAGTGRGTLVRQIGAEQVFLVPVSDGEQICVVDVVGADNASVSCGSRTNLLSTGVYLATQRNATSPAQAMVVAPDGYTTAISGARSVTVPANLAVIEPAADGKVTLSGPHLPSVTFHLGPLAGPPTTAKPAQAAPTAGRVPLVTTGPCTGLTVVSYIPMSPGAAPADAWRISPGAAANRITIQGDSLLYLRASGPCAAQLRYLPHTANIQGPSGTEMPFSFVDSIGFIVAHSATSTQTATVDLLLGCTSQGCGATATTAATLTLTITPRTPGPTLPPMSSSNPSATVRSTGR